MSKAMEAAELAVRLNRNTQASTPMVPSPERIAQDALKLMRLSASLRGIHVHECNGTMPVCPQCHGDYRYPATFGNGKDCTLCQGSGIDARRSNRLVKAVTETLAPYGLKWTHNTDPRGAAVGILFPDGSYNTMGGREEGWRI